MPQYLEPPPTYIKDFNWHWAQWFNKVFESLSFRGGLVELSAADVSSLTTTASVYTPVNFDNVIFDSYNMYDLDGGEGGNAVLRIPANVDRIRYTVQHEWDLVGTNADIDLQSISLFNSTLSSGNWQFSGADFRPGQSLEARDQSLTTPSGGTRVVRSYGWTSGVVNVQEGDELCIGARYDVNSGTVTTVDISKDNNQSFLAWEIIE